MLTDEMKAMPQSVQPTPAAPPRKPPAKRTYQEDEINAFLSQDIIGDFSELNSTHAPPGFQCTKSDNSIVFFNLTYIDGFTVIFESIKVDQSLHVQLQFNGHPVPLPAWFTKGRNATLTRFSQLNNFPNAIRVVFEKTECSRSLLNEMLDISNYQAKGRPPYSSAMIRFALHLRYTSLQSYKLLEKFPLPSISTLHRIQAGGVDSLKAAKKLREKGHISSDVILMVDEMFLQKEASYQSGDYVGEDEEGELYKGISCFMIVGLKQSVPHVIQAIPEVTITGEWLAEKISASLHSLAQTGFTVRGIVTDNHNSNVNAFKSLKQKFGKGDQLLIQHPSNPHKNIYLFFDTPHLIKNVRNNLLNSDASFFLSLIMKKMVLKSIVQPDIWHGLTCTEYTSHCFAIMDYSYNIVQALGVSDVRAAYTQIFDRFSPQIDICCSKHNNWGLKFAAKIVINTFFNNKQTVSSDSARKDIVVAFKKRQRTK